MDQRSVPIWADQGCGDCGFTRQLLEQASFPVFVVNVEGAFLFINDACLKMIGSPGREHSLEYNVFTLPTIKAVGIDLLIRRALSGETVESEFDYLSMFGKPARGSMTCIPLRQDSGEVVAVATLVNLQQAAGEQQVIDGLSEELEAARLEMRELDRLRKRFMAIVSHELRTPLAPLLGYLQMLQEGQLGPLAEAQQKAVDVATRNTQRLIEQVEKILSVTTERGSHRPRSLIAVDTCELVTEASESMAALVSTRQLTLEASCEEGTPAVAGDQEKLVRVLMTLLDNAIKFADQGGRVSLQAEAAGDDMVSIEVANTGQPIAPEERKRIFEPFYQVEHPSTRSHGGIGLGLAIVRETVLAHGGSIKVVEREGFDAAIRLELPRAGARRDIAFRVLVVDHDPQRRQQLEALLGQRDYEVRALDTARAATSTMAQWPPTALLLATDDPAGEGLPMIQTIRAGGKGRLLPIIALLTEDNSAARREALDAGATAVLVDPLDQDWLLRLLAAVYPAYF